MTTVSAFSASQREPQFGRSLYLALTFVPGLFRANPFSTSPIIPIQTVTARQNSDAKLAAGPSLIRIRHVVRE